MSDPDLVLLLRFDQRRRWEQGDRVSVEAYLETQPALRDDPDGLLDLIYHEVVLRAERAETPQLDEYVRRFPDLADQLRVQFEVHQAIEGDPPTRIDPAPSSRIIVDRMAPPVGAFTPGYEILGELGRGGMGVVYKARQNSLKRLVALKLILGGPHASPRQQQRFRTEAEAAARLQHPNIVQIHEVGEHDGYLFLSLELVDGPSLDRQVAGQPQPARPAAELVEKLARAMHYAHQRGIVHRDLKPGNVLLSFSRERSASADPALAERSRLNNLEPKITDFGLARLLDAEGGGTSETLVGTPQYMAPEQTGGREVEVGPEADVHALGAILYELLTGRPPFHGRSLPDVLEQVRSRTPVPPRRRAKVPRDLETVCLKCLEKEPARRYASAGDLADDLRRFLAGEPVLARPVPAWRRVVKWAARRPTAAALAAVSVAAVLSLAGFALWHREDVRNTEQQARAGVRQEVEEARRRYQQFLRGRDDAIFYSLYETVFSDSDRALNRKATREAAEAALALVGADAGSEAAPVLDPLWGEPEQAEVRDGCYQLLLVLAEVAAQPATGQSPDGRRRHARQALAVLDLAARLVPPTRAYHLRRARYLSLAGDVGEARRESARAAQLSPERMRAFDHFLLGEEHYRQGQIEQAEQDFVSALEDRPKDYWSRCYLALCRLKQNHPDEAEKHLSRCIDQRPRFAWTFLLRAFAREKRGDFRGADADYQTVLGLDPNPDAVYCLHVNRGRLRGLCQQGEAATADLRAAIALKPEGCEAYVELARLHLNQKRFLDAAAQLDHALRLDPPPPLRANYEEMRAFALYSAGRYKEAVGACEKALALPPGSPAVRTLRARALLDLGEYAEAVRGYDDAVRQYGQTLSNHPTAAAEIYRGRGQAHMKLEDYESAVDDYKQAVSLQPDAADLHTHLGWAYFASDAWKLALRHFEKALQRNPDDTDALVGRGLARVMLGEYRDAVADARAALRRKPDTPEMTHNIACTFAQAAGKVETDATEADRLALAAGYRREAIDAVRQTLELLAASQRPSFWRDKILPDAALDPIRNCPDFQQLIREYGGSKPAASPPG
jgi:tetratricopeptide (TPR) repeat protein